MPGICIWLTGLPSSGKTTIANALSERFELENIKHDILDGDVLRSMYTKSLGFTKQDRLENGKTVSFLVSKIVKHNGVAIVSLISPYKEMRDYARSLVEAEDGTFIEVFVDAPIEKCIERDVKGLYKKALSGEIKNFTGISDPYEIPENPEVHIRTDQKDISDCVSAIFSYACYEGYFPVISKPRALFIGRWQPFHNGHDYIIRKKLEEGIPVLIAVRDTPVDESNPFSVKERMDMIKSAYVGEDVQVISIPDIESVNIGRNVGYAVNEYQVPENIKGISATQIRKLLLDKNFAEISKLVPEGVVKYLQGFSCLFSGRI